MSKKKNDDKEAPRIIALNRRARHDYFIEETYEAGLMLVGWEVKSLRDGRGNIAEAYVVLKNGEAWLIGAQFSPLLSASTHVVPEPTRTRKLLLNAAELAKLIGKVERAGYTLVPLDMHWTRGFAKAQIGLEIGRASCRERV